MWRAEDLGGLELFRATISEFTFHPHAHEEFFIALTETGLATPTYRGDRHVIGPGDLIVLNPEEAHAGGPPAEGSWTYRALYRRFHRLSELPGSSLLEREAYLAATLVLLVSRYAAPRQAPRSPGRERRAIRLSREYLEEHAEENVTLQALARFAGLSAFHLCRVFRDSVGMPPHSYQTQVRVRRAKSLLRAGLPITQVAAEAGFYDQAHLTRHFKRIVGLTPGRYVKEPGRR